MPQVINLLIFIFGLFTAAFGLLISHGNPALLAVAAAGIGLIITAYISDKRRAQRKEDQQRSNTAKRLAQLTQTTWRANQSLEIRGGQWPFILAIIFGIASIFSLYIGITAFVVIWPLVFVGAALLLFTLIVLPLAITSLGKPTLILDRDGFATPLHGCLPWKAVDGIYLQQYTINGVAQSTLIFRIINYQSFNTEPHFILRVLALFGLGAIKRGVINVVIKNSNEQPDTIYTISRYLWKFATGRDYDWSPLFSEAFNEAAKRMSNVAIQQFDSDNIEKRLQESPDEVFAEIAQMDNDLKLMREEQTRRLKKSYRNIIIVIILMLLALGGEILKHL